MEIVSGNGVRLLGSIFLLGSATAQGIMNGPLVNDSPGLHVRLHVNLCFHLDLGRNLQVLGLVAQQFQFFAEDRLGQLKSIQMNKGNTVALETVIINIIHI